MRIKIIGLAFAIAVLSMIGFAYFGTSGTAEAAIDPIVQSQCAAQDSQSDNSGATGRDGQTAGNEQHPPGQIPGHSASDESNLTFRNTLAKSGGHADSGEGSSHCTNAPPSP